MRCLVLALLLLASWSSPAPCEPPTLLGVWGSHGTSPGQFIGPTGVAVAPDGHVYVADMGNHRIQVLAADGSFLRQWGADGVDPWSLTAPLHLAVDQLGHVFVTEWIWSSDVQTGFQIFSTAGDYLSSWVPFGPGSGIKAFGSPFGVAVDPTNRVFIQDDTHLYIYANDGTYLTYWPVSGRGLGADTFGNIYSMDTGCPCVRKFNSSGAQETSWASSAVDLAVDAQGNVYVADTFGDQVIAYDTQGTELARWGTFGSEPGQFDAPWGIAVGPGGRIYVADTRNDRIQVFGIVATPAASASWGAVKAMYR